MFNNENISERKLETPVYPLSVNRADQPKSRNIRIIEQIRIMIGRNCFQRTFQGIRTKARLK